MINGEIMKRYIAPRIEPITFPITETIRVRKKDNGLQYFLNPKETGYYICAVDSGGVSGQMMFWDNDTITKHLERIILP